MMSRATQVDIEVRQKRHWLLEAPVSKSVFDSFIFIFITISLLHALLF